ncbi:MAG TPA: hypothetical protein VGS19_07345 [Streptosporangiaceae bacterium]|nr:hypothetical protein [Streptosporangiaceae bacterium]
MTYWKFLRSGRVSPFSGFAWEPGTWYTAGAAQWCEAGFHACRAADLPYWLNDELWQVELSEPVLAAPHKVVAARARVLRQVGHWTPGTARELALECARRSAVHAVAELAEAGLGAGAEALRAAAQGPEPQLWAQVAHENAIEARARGARQAALLCDYVGDAVLYMADFPAATIAYIAARAASQRSSADTGDPYTAERKWQADWLVRTLGLS